MTDFKADAKELRAQISGDEEDVEDDHFLLTKALQRAHAKGQENMQKRVIKVCVFYQQENMKNCLEEKAAGDYESGYLLAERADALIYIGNCIRAFSIEENNA